MQSAELGCPVSVVEQCAQYAANTIVNTGGTPNRRNARNLVFFLPLKLEIIK